MPYLCMYAINAPIQQTSRKTQREPQKIADMEYIFFSILISRVQQNRTKNKIYLAMVSRVLNNIMNANKMKL